MYLWWTLEKSMIARKIYWMRICNSPNFQCDILNADHIYILLNLIRHSHHFFVIFTNDWEVLSHRKIIKINQQSLKYFNKYLFQQLKMTACCMGQAYLKKFKIRCTKQSHPAEQSHPEQGIFYAFVVCYNRMQEGALYVKHQKKLSFFAYFTKFSLFFVLFFKNMRLFSLYHTHAWLF